MLTYAERSRAEQEAYAATAKIVACLQKHYEDGTIGAFLQGPYKPMAELLGAHIRQAILISRLASADIHEDAAKLESSGV